MTLDRRFLVKQNRLYLLDGEQGLSLVDPLGDPDDLGPGQDNLPA